MSQSRPPIVRPAPGRDGPTPHLETGFGLHAAQRSGVIAAYSLMMLCGAVVVLAVPDVAPWPTALLFAAIGVIHPVVARRVTAAQMMIGQHLVELVVFATVVLVAPEFWPVACVWMGTSLTWSAIVNPRRVLVAVTLVTTITMAVVAMVAGVGLWPLGIVAAAVVALASGEFGSTIKREIARDAAAMTDSISATGGFIVHADVATGTTVKVDGDIHGVLGYTPDEWCRTPTRDLVHPDDRETYWIDADDVRPDTVVDRLARYRHADGSWVWVRDVTRVTVDADGSLRMQGFISDVGELMEANLAIAEQARRDSLTGLPNRLALVERIEQHIADAEPFALLLLDLDRFKEVNDTLGHEAGDQMLEVVAERIREALTDDDLIARLGGDEFSLVIPGARSETDLIPVLRHLSAIWARPLTLRGVRTAISASVGVAFSDPDDTDRPTLMRHADIAMYESKRRATPYCVFDDSLEHTSTMQLTLSAGLPTAIANGDIRLYFQPKFDMATGRLVGAEGLARWVHPELGLLTPDVFLDLTLMSEYAVAFALRTIDHTVAAIERLSAAGCDVPIAANVAIGALRDIDFGDEVVHRLRARGLDPGRLTVELTESDVLGPSTGITASVDRLIGAGVTMSIDDFGTGHSSLERLRVLDVGELKIDRSFVNGMTLSPLDRKIVETIVDLARRLECDVVAEGVETEEQVAMLLELGCSTAQGYLYARPMPLDELVAFVTTSAATADVALR